VSEEVLLNQRKVQPDFNDAPHAKHDPFAQHELPAKERPTEAGGTAIYELPNDNPK
jgi:hypothetical protein